MGSFGGGGRGGTRIKVRKRGFLREPPVEKGD